MITYETQWRRTTPDGLINANEVHVWRMHLDVTTFQLESLLGILSADELARVRGFRFERDQKRFIVARGILRKILSHYLRINPHKIQFEYTSFGKPILASNSGYNNLNFNLSHSDAFALYAITSGGSIGIDIERIRDNVAVEQIAQRFFSPDEISLLERIHKNQRSKVFFQYWTRKEAFLKAIGKGTSFPMEQCDVSLINGLVWSPITLPDDYRDNICWYGRDLFPGYGYAAAIAIEGGDWDVSCCQYSG